MGLGYALSEDLPQTDAGLPSPRYKDLGLLPMDATPPPLGPYGAKGVGEVGLVPTAAAVACAFTAFDGRPRFSLPLQPPGRSS